MDLKKSGGHPSHAREWEERGDDQEDQEVTTIRTRQADRDDSKKSGGPGC